MISLLTAIVTAIGGPLLAYAITSFINKKTAEVIAEQEEKAEEKSVLTNSSGTTTKEAVINAGIDQEQAAMQAYLDSQNKQ